MEGGGGLAETVSARLTTSQGRRFGLTVGIAFVALGGVATWRQHHTVAVVAFAIGMLLIVAGVIVPRQLGPLERAWMGLARGISSVPTPILMGIVFFAVVAPIGLVMRVFGHNPLARSASDDSFWVSRNAGNGPKSELTRQF